MADVTLKVGDQEFSANSQSLQEMRMLRGVLDRYIFASETLVRQQMQEADERIRATQAQIAAIEEEKKQLAALLERPNEIMSDVFSIQITLEKLYEYSESINLSRTIVTRLWTGILLHVTGSGYSRLTSLSVGHIVHYEEHEWLRVTNLGDKTINLLRGYLAKFQLNFGMKGEALEVWLEKNPTPKE
jgi:hypothetical protein